jgi:hypothetical protein
LLRQPQERAHVRRAMRKEIESRKADNSRSAQR